MACHVKSFYYKHIPEFFILADAFTNNSMNEIIYEPSINYKIYGLDDGRG